MIADRPLALRCPTCTAALPVGTGPVWRCASCETRYPVEDGIPVLVPPGSVLRREPRADDGEDPSARQRDYWEADSVHRDVGHPIVQGFARQRWEHVLTRFPASEVEDVLDVGCGNGFSSVCAPFAREPVGCDGALNMLRRNPLRTRFCVDATALPFADRSFDLVTCWELLHHVDEPWRVLAEMRRVTRGRVLVFEPNPRNLAQFLFALADREHRWVLRFSPGYLLEQLRLAGLRPVCLEQVGIIFPNRTPEWLYPVLRAVPFRIPLVGISHFLLAEAL